MGRRKRYEKKREKKQKKRQLSSALGRGKQRLLQLRERASDNTKKQQKIRAIGGVCQ